ncbi:MAG: hypothetical protein QME94_04975, partial [Anaerolineae bacterium]|nr:hypothetical protein [Anaerolineae bacterium]
LPSLRPALQRLAPPSQAVATPPAAQTPPPTARATPPARSTATPPAVAVRPSALPPLAALVGASGGGGGAGPARYELGASLPESPGQMTIYQVVAPAAPTEAEVTQMAGRLGMQPRLYEGPSVFDGPRELVFEPGGSAFHYRDARYSNYHNGHWYPAGTPLSAGESVASARSFLEGHGLLGFPFEALAPRFAGGAVDFLRVLEGRWLVLPAAVSVEVSPGGEVGDLTCRRQELLPAGEFAMISAEEAWELAGAGRPGDRVWYRTYPPTHCNPRYWARAYRDGQRADLFGTPAVSLPLDRSLGPRVALNEVLLSGDLQSLVEHAQSQRAQEKPVWVHVWGEVHESGGVRSLSVEGWEALASEPTVYVGRVLRQAGGASLQTADDRLLPLADLPADLVDGATVYVEGGEVQGQLEWTLIQASAPDGEACAPGAPAGEALATVERVDLVYFVPATGEAGPAYAQPVWRFAGRMDGGLLFEVWVQAVAADLVATPSH